MARLFQIWIAAIVLGVFLFVACERPTQPPNPNEPPNTTLANIPVDNDTLFALVTLHWDGEDNDGFIVAYQYRYITYHVFKQDTVYHDWVQTEATSITIPFESSDQLNYQTFQVRAVDNVGDVDPTPAEKCFYTVQTYPPVTEIISPEENEQFFIIDHVTDWWQGIQVIFHAYDQDGEVVEYAWAVDDGEWTWTTDTSLYITPEFFQPLDGEHVIRVTCRDNTNLVDPVGDSVVVKLVQPTFEKDVLIIDETDESLLANIGLIYDDAEVDSFYARIFQTNDAWDFIQHGMPSKELMGQYKVVVWHADNLYTNEQDVHKLPQHIHDIIDYMNVGGDFIMSGWRILKSFASSEPFPKTFEEGSFIHDYLHILQADESAPIADFNGAIGYAGYTDISVDSIKLAESWYTSVPVIGLPYINVMPRRAGFTDAIFRYRNDDVTGIPTFRGYPCGLRYYGTSFDAIVLGFPMFFIRYQDAQVMAAQMLHSLGINK
jgi:hypothetical protein